MARVSDDFDLVSQARLLAEGRSEDGPEGVDLRSKDCG